VRNDCARGEVAAIADHIVVAASVLELLVSVVGVPKLAAQAISIATATPLNFIGNKMWSFALEFARH
jgi:putative flippase GtrA